MDACKRLKLRTFKEFHREITELHRDNPISRASLEVFSCRFTQKKNAEFRRLYPENVSKSLRPSVS